MGALKSASFSTCMPMWSGCPANAAPEILEHERNALEGAVGKRPASRLSPLLEELMDDRVYLRIHPLDSLDRGVYQLRAGWLRPN